jgi:hypothetical protein
MSKKRKNLQPWLDYFKMLVTYESNGLLEMQPAKHEAYVTRPALHAMTEGDDPWRQLTSLPKTVRRLRAYAGWKSCEGKDYLKAPFAVHVVKDEKPHDLLYTVVLTPRRAWWKLWMTADRIDVIEYDNGKEG